MLDHGRIRTCNLWNASPTYMYCSYAVKLVLVSDISQLSLVTSTSVILSVIMKKREIMITVWPDQTRMQVIASFNLCRLVPRVTTNFR